MGDASGRYASWLSGLGYALQVVDPVPKHVALARARGLDAQAGDARDLRYPDGWAEAVVLLGPLYHLPEASDRARALAEAVRVCAPGGVVIVAAMSRWAKPADPDQLRAELAHSGALDIDVVGVEGPLGSFARQEPTLNQVAISAARVSEHLAPHLSRHLLARGRVA